MYEVKGFFRNGSSGAKFDHEDDARAAFSRLLMQYPSNNHELYRLEMWDDQVLIACYFTHGLTVIRDGKTNLHFDQRKRFFTRWFGNRGR